ncbi:MAG: hypothetical protein ACI4L1_00650 [Christensenellales bacterium]
MKKFLKFSCLCLMFISCSLFSIGCSHNEITAEFVRFNIKQKENSNDYCLDFTIKFDNNTKQNASIESNDFYIEINNEENNTISFLYEYEEFFYTSHITINANETLTLRVRIISTIKNKEYNSILFKYKNEILIEDNIYINSTN